ncbi:unnamed protein product [Rhodiola kirilowii]
MQRSRRALQNRKASDKFIKGTNFFYKVSLSLLFLVWGVLVLLSISHSDGFSEDILQCTESSSNFVNDHQHAQTKNDDNMEMPPCRQLDSTFSMADKVPNDVPGIIDPADKENSTTDKTLENGALRTSGLPPHSLDEFKSKAFNSKPKMGNEQLGISIRHRVEPGGKEYNYASASNGAKVLAYNKESKGAGNILIKDEDKYLRNPCSADDKFVVIELSEETLVDTIMLANFEHYSSNIKDLELFGSKGYPTETWHKLGNFTSPNVKHEHRFTLQEPNWARYLKLKLLSHYGSGFYCTLSVVEVYGDDAMERMLEDLISLQSDAFVPDQSANNKDVLSLGPLEGDGGFGRKLCSSEAESDKVVDNPIPEADILVSTAPDPADEIRAQQNGRMPSDTVLKIIMQKVRSVDINLSVLEKYLEELNSRYGSIFKELNREIENKVVLVVKLKSDFDSFHESSDLMAKELEHLISWKSHVSMQMDNIIKDNILLRVELEKARGNQTWVENKGIVMFFISIFFGSLAIVRLFVDVVVSVRSTGKKGALGCKTEEGSIFCYMSLSWFFLLLNCILVMFILSL